MKLVAKGAEANLYERDGFLVKQRVLKKYRIPQLDRTLRRQRTRREARYMKKASEAGLNVPKVIKVDEKSFVFEMEYVDGKLMKDVLNSCSKRDAESHAIKIGEFLRQLHNVNLIHNDLTTSNMILSSEGDIYFIDFGLAFPSRRLEDKAMDLVVFKKSLMATHPLLSDLLWEEVAEGYKASKSLLNRVEVIERRVRYS
jgi:Kae1-associated kinase Bud32